jgi:hypothetical protein
LAPETVTQDNDPVQTRLLLLIAKVSARRGSYAKERK